MKKFSLIVLFLSLLSSVYGQKEVSRFSVTAFGLPLVYSLNNINNSYVVKSNHQANLLDNFSFNSELGLNLNYHLSKTIRVGGGISYKNYQHEMGVIFDIYDNVGVLGERSGAKSENSIDIKAIGFKLFADFLISEKYKTRVALGIEFNKPISFTIENPFEINENLNDYTLSEFVSQNRMNMDHYITPEIHFTTEIAYGIGLSYGMKLRYWGNEDIYTLQIHEVNDPRNPVFDYRIDSRNLAFFVGVNYTLNLPKLRKSKVD